MRTAKKAALVFVAIAIIGLAALWIHKQENDKWVDKAFDLVGILLATLAGGWAGGAAAFRAERKTREKAEEHGRIAAANAARISRLSAANRAFFELASIHNAIANL